MRTIDRQFRDKEIFGITKRFLSRNGMAEPGSGKIRLPDRPVPVCADKSFTKYRQAMLWVYEHFFDFILYRKPVLSALYFGPLDIKYLADF